MKTSLAVLFLVFSSAVADSLFGPYAGFNLFSFGDFSCAYSDVRGRLVIGGNAVIRNYNVGCQANLKTNPTMDDQCPNFGSWTCNDMINQGNPRRSPNYYSLIAAPVPGSMVFRDSQLFGASIYGYDGASNWANVQSMSGCDLAEFAHPTIPFNFAQAKSFFQTLSTTISQIPATGTVSNNGFGTLGFVGTGTTGTEVFNIDGSVLSSANTLSGFTNVNAASIYINVNGASINLSGGNAALKPYASKIVWNFYQATQVNVINYSVFGSVVAPNAAFKNPAGVFWGQAFVGSFVSASSNFQNPSICAQVNWIPFGGPTIPAQYCGNGVVEGTEECDLGANNGASSVCCSHDCTFVEVETVCRPAAGECDVAEVCGGESAQCPADTFKPVTTPCSHQFGVCDLALQYHCPGNAAQCMSNAPTALFNWDAFNVISFDTYTVDGGDVEGALAVRNKATLASFDLGLKINSNDIYTMFSLAVAGDASWSSGEVHPTLGYPYQFYGEHNYTLPQGYIAVGGQFTAPAYLQNAWIQNAYLTGEQFDAAQQYYITISTLFAALPTNVVVSSIYGDGLLLTCSGTSDLYHAAVDGALLSKTNWYLTSGCKFTAGWIIDVTGQGPVTIKGGPFPGIVEKVVYNVLGYERLITGETGVSGNILAPTNSYTQHTGVTYGRVIVGDVPEARQNNKPNCINFQKVVVSNSNLKLVNIGDTSIYVVDITQYVVGDTVCSPAGECKKVVSGVIGDYDGDGVSDNVLLVDSPFSASIPAQSVFSTPVDPEEDRSNTIPITYQTGPSNMWDNSGAAQIGFSLVAFIAALFFF